MLFNSLQFILFFIVVYAIYLFLRHRYQNYWLLAASYFFYSCWNWRFLFLMLLSTTTDYFFGLIIYQAPSPRTKKAFLISSLAINLGILFVFKYYNFFARELYDVLTVVHFAPEMRILNVILPIGISFYTFHNLSYIIDIYRGKIEPARRFSDFALYVALFPQLVAGPIARPQHLLPQVQNPRRISYEMVRMGFWLILLGYFKKVVLADNLLPFVKLVFDRPGQASGLSIVFGLYAFAFQIYGDFSGYSDIARGLCKLMGFELILNFNHPYFATNPVDFWRRWHISLSSWLRDYLYIPLGGNRHGTLMTYRNLMITMVLGGLWHGAAWHFVAWGAFHGVLLIAHRMLQPLSESLEKLLSPKQGLRRFWRVASTIGFFHLNCLAWLFFVVRSLRDVPVLIYNFFHPFHVNGLTALATILIFATPLVLLEWAEERFANRQEMAFGSSRELTGTRLLTGESSIVKTWPRAWRLACYLAVAAAIILCGVVERHEFIYFQF